MQYLKNELSMRIRSTKIMKIHKGCWIGFSSFSKLVWRPSNDSEMVLMAHTKIITSLPILGSLVENHENPQKKSEGLFKLFSGSSRKQDEHVACGFTRKRPRRNSTVECSAVDKCLTVLWISKHSKMWKPRCSWFKSGRRDFWRLSRARHACNSARAESTKKLEKPNQRHLWIFMICFLELFLYLVHQLCLKHGTRCFNGKTC